jgi:hypothetical protein
VSHIAFWLFEHLTGWTYSGKKEKNGWLGSGIQTSLAGRIQAKKEKNGWLGSGIQTELTIYCVSDQ